MYGLRRRAICTTCEQGLDNAPGLCWLGESPQSSDAVLVDHWGRAHPLDSQTTIGRVPGDGLAVLEGSVSRHHAEIRHDEGQWFLRDLDSRNGTRVNGEIAGKDTALVSEQIVVFGDVAFYFIARPTPIKIAALTIETRQRSERGDSDPHSADTLRLASPPGQVGGIVEFNGATLQLSAMQFALVALLAERINAEVSHADSVRGFVSSSELCDKLPWDTASPVGDNVKQLLRRVRSAMVAAGVGDLIESRRRFGYRLRVVPRKPKML